MRGRSGLAQLEADVLEGHDERILGASQASLAIRSEHVGDLRYGHGFLNWTDLERGGAGALPNGEARSVSL